MGVCAGGKSLLNSHLKFGLGLGLVVSFAYAEKGAVHICDPIPNPGIKGFLIIKSLQQTHFQNFMAFQILASGVHSLEIFVQGRRTILFRQRCDEEREMFVDVSGESCFTFIRFQAVNILRNAQNSPFHLYVLIGRDNIVLDDDLPGYDVFQVFFVLRPGREPETKHSVLQKKLLPSCVLIAKYDSEEH